MSRVLVIHTGGTIAMVPRDPREPDGQIVPGGRDEILRYVPGVGASRGIEWDIVPLTDESGTPVEPLDSCNIGPRHWLMLGAQIGRSYAEFDGFVVLHGTDTMAWTASALSFLLENLAKPVVLTGAQLPLHADRSDGRMNFANALHIAGGREAVPEVAVCFADRLLRGNRTRKLSAAHFNAFDSPNYPPLAHLGESITVHRDLVMDAAEGEFRAGRALPDCIGEVALYPGIRPEAVRAALRIDGLRATLLRTFGAGNAMTDPRIVAEIGDAVAAGCVVVNVTQCPRGAVEMGRYEASHGLREVGVISGADITPEAALTKLMWLYGRDCANVAGEFVRPARGEMTPR